MQTSNQIMIRGAFDPLFARAADIARWPEILPHYRYVKILERRSKVQGLRSHVQSLIEPWTLDLGPETPFVVAEMAARHRGFPLWWKTIQLPLPKERRICFTHIAGITKGMEVEWTFVPVGDQGNTWLVKIDHHFAPRWPLPGPWFAEHVIGELFVKQVAHKTLTCMKRLSEEDRKGAA